MTDNPRISVIVPTYNRVKFIERTIHSVLSQTYPDFELIVVDDGSTDSTSSTIAALAEKDPRIQYIKHNTNRGAQSARNTGVEAARGEFVAFLDSDDEWYPAKLDIQLEAFKGLPNSVGVVHGDADIKYETTGNKRRWGLPKLSGSVYTDLLLKPGPVYPCLMVRRKCFLDIPDAIDPNVPAFQEWDTSINLAKKYEFYFIDEPLMVYNLHESDTISKNLLLKIQGHLYIVDKHREEIIKHKGRNAIAKDYFEWALKSMPLKDAQITRSCFRKALEYGIENDSQRLFSRIAVFSPTMAVKCLNFYGALKKIVGRTGPLS